MNTLIQKRACLRLYFTFIFMAGFACAAHAQQTPSAKSPPNQTVEGNTASPERAPVQAAPVSPFNQPVFSIYAKLGSFTPAERAEKIEQRIRHLAEDHNFSADQMKIVPDGATLDIVFGDIFIMAVADGDAEYFQKSKEEVAEYYKENIARAIEQYRQDAGLISILIKTGLVLLILALFFFIIRYINWFHRIAQRKIVKLRGTFIKGVRVKSYTLLDEHRCIVSVLFFARIIKYFVILTIFYFSLPLLFSIFPETRGLANKLLDYVLTPFSDIVLSVIGYLPNAITIIVTVTVFLYLTKGIKYFAGEIEKEKLVIEGFYPDWAMPTCNIIRALLFVFMFIVIFPHLPNSESKVFQGVSVFIGVLISLGSTALIGNLISGMVLTYMRPFRTGDFIKVGDVLGTVKEKTPLAIRIMTTKNEEITLPNSTIMSAHTTNYSHSAQENNLILYATVTFGYDTPWRQVHELLLSAAARTKHVLADPAPYVLQRALDNFFAEYQINVYTTEEKQMPRIYSELYGNIQDVFKEAGLDLTSPAYQSLRGENQIQVTQKNF